MTIMTYTVAAMGVVMLVQSWCLWRVLDRLGVLERFEDRLASLSHTLMLLTDTTETCFQVIASQLEKEQTERTASSTGRVGRQRRIVAAARRGRSVGEIAAQEEVAEGEARLRLHLAEQGDTKEKGRHGTMLT
ncbi:MAG: hypothetical protein ABJA98_09010 [Acidobacteriota bacterium]